MHIPTYQIHNVLNTYSLQLFKAGNAAQHADFRSDNSVARMKPETRRQAVIDKVAAEIVQRITCLDALTTKPIAPSPLPALREDDLSQTNNQFVFNTLDSRNIKTTRTLSIEDSIFFIKKDPP